MQLDEKKIRKYKKLIELRNTRVDFANTHHIIGGKNLDFVEYPYLREIYYSVHPDIVISGGTQIGKSVFLSVYMLACAYRGLNVFAVWPRNKDRDDFMKTSFKKIIGDSDQYKAISDSTVSASDAINYLYFGKGSIKAAASESERDFFGFAGDVYVADEVDLCDPENLINGYSRLDNSDYKFRLWISNPQDIGSTIIEELKKSSYKRWQVRCDQCEDFSHIDFYESVVLENKDEDGNVLGHTLRDKDWERGCGRDIHLKCPKCQSGNLNRLHDDNHWLATQTHYTDNNGVEHEVKIEGYHIPSLVSPRRDVVDIYGEYVDALNNPKLMKKFYVTKLAEEYISNIGGLNNNILDLCTKRGSDFQISDNAGFYSTSHPGPCSMGIDTNGSVLDVRISSIENGCRRAEYIGKISLLNNHELMELAHKYGVKVACIDIGPEANVAKTFQNNALDTDWLEVWRVKYQGKGKNRDFELNEVDMIAVTDRTELLDLVSHNLKMGTNIIPKNYKLILDGVYAEEMLDSREVLVSKPDGPSKKKWVSSKNDHAFHADGYDLIAHKILINNTLLGDSVYIG